jgi:stearoyl-CoA desaturase (delta-9 desaturase)
LWLGVVLYAREASRADTLEKYGFATPDDWLENNLYARYSWLGVTLLLTVELVLLGPVAILMWLVQMAWIPFWAAGVINGAGHWFGYRNFEVMDNSTNILPIGILIGGEELHNNHHAFASSARFACRPWEIDIGWYYIRLMDWLGLARVKKVSPRLVFDNAKQACDRDTVRALVVNRFHVLSHFTREVLNQVYREELERLKATDFDAFVRLRNARRLLRREATLLDGRARSWINECLENSESLHTVYAMRESLKDLWRRSAATHEHFLGALEEWRQRAEDSGIRVLREFSRGIPTYSIARSTPH